MKHRCFLFALLLMVLGSDLAASEKKEPSAYDKFLAYALSATGRDYFVLRDKFTGKYAQELEKRVAHGAATWVEMAAYHRSRNRHSYLEFLEYYYDILLTKSSIPSYDKANRKSSKGLPFLELSQVPRALREVLDTRSLSGIRATGGVLACGGRHKERWDAWKHFFVEAILKRKPLCEVTRFRMLLRIIGFYFDRPREANSPFVVNLMGTLAKAKPAWCRGVALTALCWRSFILGNLGLLTRFLSESKLEEVQGFILRRQFRFFLDQYGEPAILDHLRSEFEKSSSDAKAILVFNLKLASRALGGKAEKVLIASSK